MQIYCSFSHFAKACKSSTPGNVEGAVSTPLHEKSHAPNGQLQTRAFLKKYSIVSKIYFQFQESNRLSQQSILINSNKQFYRRTSPNTAVSLCLVNSRQKSVKRSHQAYITMTGKDKSPPTPARRLPRHHP